MTKILIFNNQPSCAYRWFSDPRPPREIMFLINTGQLRYQIDGELPNERPLTAMALPEDDLVSAAFMPAYVDLDERMYRVVFALLDGLSPLQIADCIGQSEASLPALYAQILERFKVHSMEEMLNLAKTYGVQ